MTQPLVSVVIPVYNVEAYLDKCVETVVGQTYSNMEIILVDDGSPDQCPELCDAWANRDSRIRVIHQKNAGLGMARNAGMALAEGQYIFFLDSDDYVDTTLVEKCVRNAEKTSSDAVIYGRWDVYPDGRKKILALSAEKYLFQGEEIKTVLLAEMFTYGMGFGVSAWGKMYRLQTIRSNGLRFVSERKLISEDAFFALEFFSAASVATIIPENLYFYYKRENSLSNVYRKERQQKNDAFLNTCLAYIDQKKLPDTLASHLKVRYHMYTIAAMKQVFLSELSGKEKKSVLREIFRSPALRGTLTSDVLRLEKPSQQLFFSLLKFRCYGICYFLLKLKTHEQ